MFDSTPLTIKIMAASYAYRSSPWHWENVRYCAPLFHVVSTCQNQPTAALSIIDCNDLDISLALRWNAWSLVTELSRIPPQWPDLCQDRFVPLIVPLLAPLLRDRPCAVHFPLPWILVVACAAYRTLLTRSHVAWSQLILRVVKGKIIELICYDSATLCTGPSAHWWRGALAFALGTPNVIWTTLHFWAIPIALLLYKFRFVSMFLHWGSRNNSWCFNRVTSNQI